VQRRKLVQPVKIILISCLFIGLLKPNVIIRATEITEADPLLHSCEIALEACDLTVKKLDNVVKEQDRLIDELRIQRNAAIKEATDNMKSTPWYQHVILGAAASIIIMGVAGHLK
jgi:hypothetical protein